MVPATEAVLTVGTAPHRSCPGGVLRASVDAAWRLSWVGFSEVQALVKRFGLCLLASVTLFTPGPPCSAIIRLLDTAWLGNLAGRSTLPVAETCLPYMGTLYCTLVS